MSNTLDQRLPDVLAEFYDFDCPICEYGQNMRPSLAMNMGINSGHGSCLNCDVFLRLTLDGDRCVAKLWEWTPSDDIQVTDD